MNRCGLKAILAVLLWLGLGFTAALRAVADDTERVPLTGHVLEALAKAQPAAKRASDAEPLSLTIVLRRSDEPGFERFLTDLYDPNSPQFHQFLTPQQVSDRFGPSPADFDAVRDYFVGQGFRVIDGSANRMTLTVEGTRAKAEQALGVMIRDFTLTEKNGETRSFHANVDEPTLPAEIAPRVHAIVGLSNLALPAPTRTALAGALCAAAGLFFLVPIEIATFGAGGLALLSCVINAIGVLAYNQLDHYPISLSAGRGNQIVGAEKTPTPLIQATGAGQTIALIGFSNFQQSDVRDFLSLIQAPANQINNLSVVPVNGGAPILPDQDEVLLDVDTVMSIAPGAKVVVYHAPFSGAGSFQTLFNSAINGGATIISNSWAYCEDQTTFSDAQSIDAILATAAASGISAFNASGDNGSTCLDGNPNTAHVPASSPSATAVGGTSLTPGPGFIYGSEAWWNGVSAMPPTGQGGFGVSRFFSRPSYQNGINSSSTRSVPDIAVNADPAHGMAICQASNGGCPNGRQYGGTSIAAPVWAAFAALINQAQGRNLGAFNSLLYPRANTSVFHNAASMGSDFMHVGLGSPNLNLLHMSLSGQTAGLPSASASQLLPLAPLGGLLDGLTSIPADGATAGGVLVKLRDANGNSVSGKTVTLSANPGSHALISPASGVTNVANGAVVFTVKNLSAETVTFTARDTTDNLTLAQSSTLTFAVPPATSAGINAFPTTVTANGTSSTTITVTLKDALNRPTPGKLVTLAQGGGHSLISAPNPSVTNAAGQIQFTATNKVNETVTYTAVDVSDGDLPVPGSGVVTFSGGSGTACGAETPPTGAAGFTLSPFATGFFAEPFFFSNVNWGGCPGASTPAFSGGSAFIANFRSGALYRFPATGGAVSSANQLSTLTPTFGWPVFGKDGRLYAAFGAPTGNFTTGTVVELNPATGAIVRTLASNLKCPNSLAVDPLSGDLFFDGSCFGAGSDDPAIRRIRNPASATPTVEVYATLPATPGGQMAFAPNGTLYAVSNYLVATPNVVQISGTNTPSPPTITPLSGVTSVFGLAVGAATPAGAARSLVVQRADSLKLVDLSVNPVTETALTVGSLVPGIGPDGCLYGTIGHTVFKLTTSAGVCSFAPAGASPALTLTATPANPAQGTQATLTAQFVSLAAPTNTPVFFDVAGANMQVKLGRSDASRKATVTIQGMVAGKDAIVATATVGATTLTSNKVNLNWLAGKHVTDLSLNLAPEGATVGVPAALKANLVDVSVNPAKAIVGATVQFSVGAQQCSAVTNASGAASCTLTFATPGNFTLNASYAGSAQLLPASASQAFFVQLKGEIFSDSFE